MVDQSNNEKLEAIELLYRGYRAFTEQADRILDKRGLNRAHHRILYFVGRNRDGSVADLLEALSISKQALNVPLRQLLAMELVESKRTSNDARIKMLSLTPSGKRLEARLTEAQSVLLTNVFDESGPNAEDSWRDVMRILAKTSDAWQ